MKVRVRSAAMLIAAAVFISILVGGCGKESDDYDVEGLSKFEIVQPLKPASLTFYYPEYPVTKNPHAQEVLEEIEAKVKDVLNISKLNFVAVSWPNYGTTIIAGTASGSPCDAFVVYEGLIQEIKNDHVMMDITEQFKQHAPGYYSKFSKGDLATAMINSRIIAVPSFNYPVSNRRYAVVRNDLVEKYDIKEIKSYDDLEAYLETIKKNEPDIIPLPAVWDTALGLFAETYGYVILDYELGLVYKWDDPDTRIMAWEQAPEYKDAIKRVYEWKKKEYFAKNMVFGTPDPNSAASGKFGAFIAQEGTADNYNSLLQSKGITDWKYKEFSLYPDKISQRYYPLNTSIAIHKNSTSAEHVLKFIEWIHSNQENYDLMMYGIKDKHYVIKNKMPALPDDVKVDDSYWSWNGRWGFSDVDFDRNANENKKKIMDHIESTTRYAPLQGFGIDIEPFKMIAGYRRSSFFKLEQSMTSGSFNEVSIDEYIKSQVDAGRDEMLVIVQDQVDKWKTENKE